MTELWKCSNGHEWESSAGNSVDDSPASPACPVCGAQADQPTFAGSAHDATFLPDALPPPPRPRPARPTPASARSPTQPGLAQQQESAGHPQVPGYQILRELGRGGMGVVYLARQTKLNRVVALKMLLTGAQASAEAMARFRAEAETVAQLQHANIVHIYDIGEHDGFAFLTLEYVQGGNLADTLAGRPQPAREAAQLVQTLAHAIHAAHLRGIVHRDLKPANILLQMDDSRLQIESPEQPAIPNPQPAIPKITDFGLARREGGAGLTQRGAILGTPHYMAPEQAESKSQEIGPATDVYALGAILYEMLTGRPPFDGATPLQTLRRVVTAEPVQPSQLCDVPRELEQICLRCLQKDSRRRYVSALDLANDLGRFLRDETGRLALPPAQPRARRRLVLAVAVLVVAIGLLTWSLAPLLLPGNPAQTSATPLVVQANSALAAPALKTHDTAATKSTADVRSGTVERISATGSNGKFELDVLKIDGSSGEAAQAGKAKPSWDTLQVSAVQAGEQFRRIAFVTRQIGYVASDRAIHQTTDGGQTWMPIFQAAFLSGSVHFLRFADERRGWLGCNSTVFFSEDGGKTWAPVDAGIGSSSDLAIGPDGWLLACGSAGLFQRRGPKAKWEALDLPRAGMDASLYTARHVAVTAAQSALVVMSGNLKSHSRVLRTTDGGQSWKEVFEKDYGLVGIHFADARLGWLAGRASIFVTEDGGDTWKAQLNPEDAELHFLAFAPRGSMFGLGAVSSQPKIVFTTDGKTWRSVELELKKAHFVGAAIVDATCAYLLIDDGRIVRFLP